MSHHSHARSSRRPEDVCCRTSALAYLQCLHSNVASDVMTAHDKCVPDLGSSSPFWNHQALNHACHAEWPKSGWKSFSRSPFLLRARYRSNAHTLDVPFISLGSLNLGDGSPAKQVHSQPRRLQLWFVHLTWSVHHSRPSGSPLNRSTRFCSQLSRSLAMSL